MGSVREYKLELCWLLLLVVALFTLSAATPRADGWNMDDEAADCSPFDGWCIIQH